MSQTPDASLFRSIPQVDDILNDPLVNALEETIPRPFIVEAVRDALSDVRRAIANGTLREFTRSTLVATACEYARRYHCLSLRRVINATGIIIHTNLGRSVLAQSALDAVVETARGYSTLEYNINTMQRGSRHDHCESLLCTLTGAESALAVNNNAAAVMMVLSEFAAEHEVVVSRGELVEIGGSFRVPDIMRQSHATMVEVGTTNKTHLFDYENAISEHTGLFLKVHPSNYSMVGFTESVSIDQLRNLADRVNTERSTRIVVYEDQGSGSLIDLSFLGSHVEPTVKNSIEQGCDLVSFSGDKLLGGPQAGIIVGSKQFIDRLKKNPLARALRLDKMSLAALEATLRLYLEPEKALAEIPTLAMLSRPAEAVKQDAESLKRSIEDVLASNCADVTVVPETARSGGGSLPLCDIDSHAVTLSFNKGSAQECSVYLATKHRIPIVARIKHDELVLDARTLLGPEDFAEIVCALASYFNELSTTE